MAAKGMKQVWVRLRSNTEPFEWFVHPDLRPRMLADAEERGTNLTDLALLIVCQHFQIPYAATLRKSRPATDNDVLNFGAPDQVLAVLRMAAAQRAHTVPDEVRLVLCGHYGLRVPAKLKQTRQRRAA